MNESVPAPHANGSRTNDARVPNAMGPAAVSAAVAVRTARRFRNPRGRPAERPAVQRRQRRFPSPRRRRPDRPGSRNALHLHPDGEGRGAGRRPPRRIDLRELPAFKERFDFLEGGKDDDRRTDPQTWEFSYRLQPKRGDIRDVPGVPFVFYNPDIQYPLKGFQVAYTDAIPLTVAPHEAYVVPVTGPPFLFTLAVGDPVLGRWTAWTPPGPLTATLVLAPPLLCLAWFFGWQRLYPDAARVARRRRSLAGRRALAALRGVKRLPPVQQAARSAAVVADYLRARFDAPAGEPTPAEAAGWLTRAGRSPALAERAAAFFRACDAVRFAPHPTLPHPRGEGREGGVRADLKEEAAAFILAVEAET